MMPSAEMRSLQHVIASQIYGLGSARKITSDGLLMSFERNEAVTLRVSLSK